MAIRNQLNIRFIEWWSFIVPFLLGLGYVFTNICQVPFIEGITASLLFMVTIPATAVLGYFLNDITDRNEDRMAGKKNITIGLSVFNVSLILILVLCLAILPWFFLPRSKVNITLYSLQIFLLLAYSVPPVRLKRFPFPAVIIDALYNSVVPVFIIASTFVLLSRIKTKIPIIIWFVVFFWAFSKGLRGILLHQVKDRKNDRRANLNSFVLKYGPLTTINVINKYTLPAETVLFLFIILNLSFVRFPFMWIIFPLFGLYLFFFFRLWERKIPWRRREAKFRYLYILNDLYEEWLPVAALIYLPFLDPWYLLLWPLHVLLFNRTFRKFYHNFRLNQKNYADLKQYLKRQKNEAISFIPSLPVAPCLSADNKVVHGLWIGNRLSVIELLTIKSFLNNGHDFHLWTYEKIQNLPDGVTVRDASLIIPKSEIIVRKFNDPVTGVGKGSVGAPFSDLFRYKLLYEYGGWWVDMDVTCLKPLQFEEPYFFRDHLLLDVIGNVMKCPEGSELMLRSWQETRSTCDENTLDWLLPNKILNKHIRELDLLKFRKKEISNRDKWPETKRYIRSLRKIPESWYVMHWSNEEWRMNGLDKEYLRLKNTTLGFLMEKFGVKTDKANFIKMLKNDVKLAQPFLFIIPGFIHTQPVFIQFKGFLNHAYWEIHKPINKIYWYFHGHIKYWYNWSRKTFKY